MTLRDIENILLKAAREDINLARKEGVIAITDTAKGVITLKNEECSWEIFDRMGAILLSTNSTIEVMEFLTGVYQFEFDGEIERKS